jgi:3-deoxy-D-manno-octulosonic-acid transferase
MQGFEEHPELMKELGEKAGAYVASLSGATEKVLSAVF